MAGNRSTADRVMEHADKSGQLATGDRPADNSPGNLRLEATLRRKVLATINHFRPASLFRPMFAGYSLPFEPAGSSYIPPSAYTNIHTFDYPHDDKWM